MAHRKHHWAGKLLVSSNCGVTLVRRAFTLRFLAETLSSASLSVSNAAFLLGSVGPTRAGDQHRNEHGDSSGARSLYRISRSERR